MNIILGKQYLLSEQSITQVDAAEKIEKIWKELNRIVEKDQCKIIKSNGKFCLIRENDDLVLVGSGGFANIYRQKSTGIIIKKLRDDFFTDKGIRSRFKREYNITKSLQGTFVSYKVAKAVGDKATYVRQKGLDEEVCMQLILSTLKLGPAKKADLFAVLKDALPDVLTEEQKSKKLSNLLQKMKKDGLVDVRGIAVNSEWYIKTKD